MKEKIKEIVKKNKKDLLISFIISLFLFIAAIYGSITLEEEITILTVILTEVIAMGAVFVSIKKIKSNIKKFKERKRRKKDKKKKKEKEYPFIEGEKNK